MSDSPIPFSRRPVPSTLPVPDESRSPIRTAAPPLRRDGDDPRRPESTADLLVRAGAAVLADRRARSARTGIPLTTFEVLDVLDRVGPLVQRELAARAGIGPTTLTPVVDAITAAGLAVRVTDPEDRRARRVSITDTGRAALRAARPAARGPRLPDLPPSHAEAVREYLFAVIALVEQYHHDARW